MPTGLNGRLIRSLSLQAAASNRTSGTGSSTGNLRLKRLLALSLANEPDNTNAQYVKVAQLQKLRTMSGKTRIRAVTITRIPGQLPRRYDLTITGKTPDVRRICDDAGVVVECTCPRFKYMWEVALNHAGAADIKYSNGEFPSETNPSLKIACCKHLTRLMLVVNTRNL